MMKIQQKDNAKFSFLLPTNNNFRYYRHKLKAFVALKEQNKLLPDAPPVAKSTNNNAIIGTLESSSSSSSLSSANITTNINSSASITTASNSTSTSSTTTTSTIIDQVKDEHVSSREAYDAALVVAQRYIDVDVDSLLFCFKQIEM